MQHYYTTGSASSRTAAGHWTATGRLLLLTLLLFAFIGGTRAEETISIGTGTETTMTSPFSSSYNYSFVEQIYTADEMKVSGETVAGTITAISFYQTVTSSVATSRTYDIVVYMKNVTRSTFPSDNVYESVAASDIVFNGTWTIPAQTGWVTITLDTPFWYDGQSNLLIAIDENSSGYSQHTFCYTWKDGGIITFESNDTNPDPDDLASYISSGGSHYKIGYRSNIQIAITPTTCDTPGTLTADPVTANAATLNWTGTSDAFNVQYKKASETNWTDALTNSTATTTTLSGLDAGTLYNARVQGVCTNMTSKWKTITFSTDGDAITTFPWSENFESYSTGDFFTAGWLNQHSSDAGSYVFQIDATNIGGNSTKKLMLPLQKSGENSLLRLPVMNLPGNNYELVLNVYRSNNDFNPSGYRWEGIRVYVSNDGSFKNNQVAFIPRQYNSDTGTAGIVPAEEATGWYTYEIPIGQSGPCYIYLLGLSQYCLPTYLDNLVVKEMPTCMKPTGLTCSGTTITTATLSWSLQDATQTAWDVQVATNADFSEGTRLVENVNVHDSYQLGGLSPETTYFVRVRGNCGSGDVSDWSNTVSFTTPVACVVPTGLTATLTPGNGTIATLSWTENGDDTDWVLEYGTAADFTGATSVNVSGEPSCSLTGLTAETTYYARVKAVEGEYQSAWSSAVTFTPTNAYVVTVNDGTSTTNNAPVYGLYKSSYVQMVYTASQLESAGISGPCTINRICFNSQSANSKARKPVIYICHAPDDKSSFSNNTDFVSINEFTKVYDYELHSEWNITAGWNEFELDTPFTYDGSSNLVIAVHCGLVDNYSGSYFYYAETSASQVLYAYSDTSDPVPSTYEGNWSSYSGSKSTGKNLPSLKMYYDPVAISCPKPTDLSAGTLTAHDATLSWTEAGSADEWVLQYGTDNSFATYTEVTTGFAVSGSTVTATLSNLVAETTYYVRVKAVCGGGDESFWSRISFTTSVACLAPTDLACSEYTTNSATLSWTENGQATAWEICLNNDETNVITAATNPYTLTGLNASSSYTAKVRAVNSADERSAWSAALNFNTACGAITSFPWSEDFESYATGDFIHPCWVNEHIEGNGNQIFKISSSTNGTNGTHQLQLPDMKEGTLTRLVLPEMTLPQGTNYQFVLDVYRSSTYSSYTTEGIRVFASADGNISGATELAFIPRVYSVANDNIPAESAEGWYTYELPIGFSGTCYIILRGESKYGAATYMDNFVIEEAPEYLKPSNLDATNLTTTSATLSWTENGHATVWEICLNGDENALINANSNPFTIEGLTASTTYTAKVRAVGSGDERSSWSPQISFSTTCGVITDFPWTEDFEGYAEGNFTNLCWVNEHIEGNGNQIFKISSSTNGTNTTHQLQLPDQSSGNMTKLVLPEMTLPQGTNYQFVLDVYRSSTYSSYTTEGIRVFASADGNISGATELAFIPRVYSVASDIIPAETAEGWYTYELPIGFSGTCYIILRGESKYGAATYMDNFVIEEAPECQKPSNLDATNITATSATLNWTENGIATEWVIDYNGTAVNVTEKPFTLTGLANETNYTVKVRPACDDNLWSSEITFTTLAACQTPTDPAATNVTGHTAQVDWTGYSDIYTVSYRTAAYVDGTAEEFNTSGIPSDWTQYKGLADEVIAGTATLEDGGSWGTNSYALGSYNAKLNIYGTSCKSWLVTPEATLGSGSALSFDMALTDYNNANGIEVPNGQADDRFLVLITTDGGGTWTILREWNNSGSTYVYNDIATAGENVIIDLSVYDGQTVKVAFYGESTVSAQSEDNDLHIDNVTIGFGITAGEWQSINTDEMTANLTGLTAETKYELKVQGDCGAEGMSKECKPFFFITDVACVAPIGLAASNPKSTSIDLTWTSLSDAWQICVDDDETNLIGINDNDVTIDGSTVSYKLTGLTENTDYTIKVRSNCGGVDGTSLWTSTLSFTTLESCAQPTDVAASNINHDEADITWIGDSPNFTLSYRTAEQIDGLSEGFDKNSIPTDWKQYTGLLEDVMNGSATLSSTSGWYFSTKNGVFDYHTYLNIYGNSRKHWLVTPGITLPAVAVLSFDLALTAYTGNEVPDPATTGTDDKFVVLISTDNMTTWTVLRQWDNAGSTYVFNNIACSATGENVTIDLSSYAGETAYIAFYGESTESNADNDLHIDNVSIGVLLAAGEWQTATATGGSTAVHLSDLTPSKKYDVTVTPSCDQTNVSDVLNFTTLDLLELADNAANSTIISAKDGKKASVKLQGRKIWKDGNWNTLSLPFPLGDATAQVNHYFDGTQLEGAIVMELNGTTSNLNNGTLTLNFDNVTTIRAGVPYLIKWVGTSGIIENPIFSSVTIDKTMNDVEFTGGAFKGTYNYTQYTTENKSILFLGSNNTLYYPQPNFTDPSNPIYPSIGAFRAYFNLDTTNPVREFRLNFGFGEEMGIVSASKEPRSEGLDAWYTIDGVKLDKEPTRKGLYIHRDKKVVIK